MLESKKFLYFYFFEENHLFLTAFPLPTRFKMLFEAFMLKHVLRCIWVKEKN